MKLLSASRATSVVAALERLTPARRAMRRIAGAVIEAMELRCTSLCLLPTVLVARAGALPESFGSCCCDILEKLFAKMGKLLLEYRK